MISPIVYAFGGLVLLGGGWYAYSKWAGPSASKCLSKGALDGLLAGIAAGTTTPAAALATATQLEKDGCAASDVKAIRDAAAKKSGAACPPSDYADAMAKVASMTFEDVARTADAWAAGGCPTEAKALRDAFAKALVDAVLIKKSKVAPTTPEKVTVSPDITKPDVLEEGWKTLGYGGTKLPAHLRKRAA